MKTSDHLKLNTVIGTSHKQTTLRPEIILVGELVTSGSYYNVY